MKGLILNQDTEGKTLAQVTAIDEAQLPEGDITINVGYSAINYKDALAITGKGKIVRSFPFVPGIDLCGEVCASANASFPVGMKVVATGWGIGERHWGGLAEKARLKAKWVTPLPEELDEISAMSLGTAGITAMLCVDALRSTDPGKGPMIVSGASGGVGSLAVKLLAELGYEVTAVTSEAGKDWVRELGAKQCVMREEMAKECRPLEGAKWAGGADTVGGTVLSRILAESMPGSSVAACGLAGGVSLKTTVMPFILRGVKLIGIDSVYIEPAKRVELWQFLAKTLKRDFLHKMATVISLDEAATYGEQILKGETTGRIVVDVKKNKD